MTKTSLLKPEDAPMILATVVVTAILRGAALKGIRFCPPDATGKVAVQSLGGATAQEVQAPDVTLGVTAGIFACTLFGRISATTGAPTPGTPADTPAGVHAYRAACLTWYARRDTLAAVADRVAALGQRGLGCTLHPALLREFHDIHVIALAYADDPADWIDDAAALAAAERFAADAPLIAHDPEVLVHATSPA